MSPVSSVPWPLLTARLAAFAFIGWGLGALAGWLVARTTRSRPAAVLKNGLVGAGASLAGFLVAALMPWPRNTITYEMDGSIIFRGTRTGYQHPELVAITLSILLPLLHELYRWRKRTFAKHT